MAEKIVPRALEKMDHSDFLELFHLNSDCPWLQSESEGMIELWNFCNEKTEREMISALLRMFEVVDSSKLKNYGEQVASVITDQWDAKPAKARIVAVSDKLEADGSQAFLQSLKNKFTNTEGWAEKNFINDMREAVNVAKDGWTIILLDDFIGTGKTITRKTDWYLKELVSAGKNSVNVKVVAIAGMESSRSCLDYLDVECFCPIWLRKGITDQFAGAELLKMTKAMMELEKKLANKFKGLFLQSFGYGKSEALFCVEAYNVPNNVFPIFWWPVLKDHSRRKTLFKRLR